MLARVALLAFACVCLCPAATVRDGFVPVRADRRPVAGGSELITYFQRIPIADGSISEIPLIAVLNDTVGLHEQELLGPVIMGANSAGESRSQ
jgi:hypothetical protein